MNAFATSDEQTTDTDTDTKRTKNIDSNEQKQTRNRHNITTSDIAWQGLSDLAKSKQISVSELLERIGVGLYKLWLVDDQFSFELADIPMYRRLRALMQAPQTVFISLITFIILVSERLGLSTQPKEIADIIIESNKIILCIGISHPDTPISNASALLRYLCFKCLMNKFEKTNKNTEQKDKEIHLDSLTLDQVSTHICKIGNALEFLRKHTHAPAYQALKMKALDGLTIKQISRIFKYQRYNVDKVDVAYLIKQGLASFRNLVENDDVPSCPEDNFLYSTKKGRELKEMAMNYCKLTRKNHLKNKRNQEDLEGLILKTKGDSYWDFWLNELDGYWLTEKDRNSVYDVLNQELDPELLKLKKKLNIHLASNLTAHKLRICLKDVILQETGIDLSLGLILCEKW